MAYNTVVDILELGRISLDDFPESEIETAIAEADDEINLRIPPLTATDTGYDRYARRLNLITRAHGYLTLSFAYKRLSYDTIAHAEPGDPFSAGGDLQFGAKTPEINTIADFYRKLSQDYREQAEETIKKAKYKIPICKRPTALDLS